MKSSALLTVFVFCMAESFGQTGTFSLIVSEPVRTNLVVTADLSKITSVKQEKVTLYKNTDGKRIFVPCQSDGNRLVWIIEGPVQPGKIDYELDFGLNVTAAILMKAVRNNGQLTIQAGTKDLLRYQFETHYPPAGIDTVFKRSAFIHPLWTPHGQILTRIQPPDHFHHFGIWNPWTRVLFEGDTVDFWNLGDKKGTVRFAGFTKIVDGPVFSEYEALHKHIVFKKDGTEKPALDEWQKVRVYKPDQDAYIVDIAMTYRCAGDSPFKILEYRYAGLGWRATGEWNKENCEVLTSEGKTRNEADGSLANWLIVQGSLGTDYGGMAIFSDTGNYNHPEPLRIWPDDMNGRGDVFVNFAPTKNKDWLLEPGKTYRLNYRFVVFNGHVTPEWAREEWQAYTSGGYQIVIP